jgi:hypothetical protein
VVLNVELASRHPAAAENIQVTHDFFLKIG